MSMAKYRAAQPLWVTLLQEPPNSAFVNPKDWRLPQEQRNVPQKEVIANARVTFTSAFQRMENSKTYLETMVEETHMPPSKSWVVIPLNARLLNLEMLLLVNLSHAGVMKLRRKCTNLKKNSSLKNVLTKEVSAIAPQRFIMERPEKISLTWWQCLRELKNWTELINLMDMSHAVMTSLEIQCQVWRNNVSVKDKINQLDGPKDHQLIIKLKVLSGAHPKVVIVLAKEEYFMEKNSMKVNLELLI